MSLCLNCFLIEPAEKFIYLLSKPITSHKRNKEEYQDLYSKWLETFTSLYNSRYEFLIMAKATTNKSGLIKYDDSFKNNYSKAKNTFEKISLNKDENIDINTTTREWFSKNSKRLSLIAGFEEDEKTDIELSIFHLTLFMFQYLHEFEENSINMNLWNYCLRSSTFSKSNLFIGLFTLVCQFTLTGALIFSVVEDFEPTTDNTIILITAMSTIISLLYSYDTICSFVSSLPLYRFLINLYDDYPELILSKEEQKLIYLNKRNINMKKPYIIYNLISDALSNCLLPIIIPIINVFIILNSESVVDSILNCMAIFFIINIDEELYSVTQYESDQYAMNFSRWVISSIYCKHFPEFKDIFKFECENWQTNVISIAQKIKKRSRSKVSPAEVVFDVPNVALRRHSFDTSRNFDWPNLD